MIRLWHFRQGYSEIIFRICCTLKNLDIHTRGGHVLRVDGGHFNRQWVAFMIKEKDSPGERTRSRAPGSPSTSQRR
jgi:hypothetical protein